jgi:ATP-dependent 26S proteasome regulatory subunit
MNDTEALKSNLTRYLKARIPFISIRSQERSRVIKVLTDITKTLSITTYCHTLSKGTRQLGMNTQVNEDLSVAGALDFANLQIGKKQNLSFVFTEISELEDDCAFARQVFDSVMLATETGGALIVITNKPIWSQLQRLGLALTLDPPTEDEMLTIIKEQIDDYRGQMKIEWDTEDERKAATILSGITQIEAENVIASLLANGQILKSDIIELVHIKDAIFSDISGLEKVELRGNELNVGGLSGLKHWLDREKPLLTADLRENGIRPPRGVLLVGVPGCGKSLSAKAIAASWDLPLYRLDLSTIQGSYIGQSEGRLKDALNTADHVAPCVLWIDEIEKGLAGAMQANDGGVGARLVGQFLFWLQESRARVFVVATANDVSKLPPELLRRGRFDELFFVDLPSPEERKEIIQIYIKKGLKRQVEPALIQSLVELSEGFAGADIEAAVRDVVKASIIDGDSIVTNELFENSFKNSVPLSRTSPEQIDAIRNWGKDRAVPASGKPIGTSTSAPSNRGGRQILR